MELNERLLEKAKNAKSVEELVNAAKENGVELTAEEAKTYFSKLNIKYGELDDDEIDGVAGGRKCGTIYYHEMPVVTACNSCEHFRAGINKSISGQCQDCRNSWWNGSLLLCTCEERRNN